MPTASPVTHPLGPPVINGNEITVDMMLKQPTRITRMISDITLQRFIADRIFASAGGVTGGALIYDEVQANELYTTRDVELVAPGGEFPIVTDERLAPKVALVEKWGGKGFVTVEARDRNDVTAFVNQVRKLGNTVVRKLNARAIETLEASIATSGQTIVGHDWSTVTLEGTEPTANALRPTADFGAAWLSSEVDELGLGNYNLWIMNPAQYLDLVIIYADKLPAVLAAAGISIYVSNRVVAGTAYAVMERQVGEMRIEQPLMTENWYEQKTQRNWFQTSVRPLWAVTNPFAVIKFTGLAG